MAEQEQRTPEQVYKDLFAGPDGEFVLRDLMRQCHVFSPLTVGDSYLETAFNDGQRSVVLSILARLGRDRELPREFAEQINENPIPDEGA